MTNQEPKYKIGEPLDFFITREEADYDRACDEAYRHALMLFDVDDCGHILSIKDSERSTDSIMVQFVKHCQHGGMSGRCHRYDFVAVVERCEE